MISERNTIRGNLQPWSGLAIDQNNGSFYKNLDLFDKREGAR